MGQTRSAAEVFNGNNGNYTGVCAGTDLTTLKTDITGQGGTSYNCYDSATAYCAEVKMNSGQWWCVNSALVSQQVGSDPTCTTGTYTCP